MNIFDKVVSLFGTAARGLPKGQSFISYSYADSNALEGLLAKLPEHVTALPFKPIEAPPSQMVSSKLIESIRACTALIYIDTPRSKKSRWVSLEKDYARRIQLPVFQFRPRSEQIKRDNQNPMDLAVFPSYHREDENRVRKITKIMREERGFDLFMDEDIPPGVDVLSHLKSGIHRQLKRGGYTVVFWSQAAESSEFIKLEVEKTLEAFPDQILIALLDDTIPSMRLASRCSVQVFSPFDKKLNIHLIDDLIVWLYWFIENHKLKSRAGK